MKQIKTPQEIEGMERSCQLLAQCHEALASKICAGMTTLEVDQFIHTMILDNGGFPAQLGYEGYPFATCISVNDGMCHCFPDDTILKDGDLVKVDFCIDLDGYLSDSCWSYCIGNQATPEVKSLMDATYHALELGIEQARAGKHVGDIGFAMHRYISKCGYKLSLDFAGHGLGPTIHEEPMIPFVGIPGKGPLLEEGMVITIEPIVNVGSHYCTIDDNGWTARTKDGSLSCQYEHTLVVKNGKAQILTLQNQESL